jgi:regulator of replication initiation timing
MTEKQFKINTSEIGYIYIDNLKGEHMSWVELEKTLNRLYAQNKELFKENKELKKENQHIKNTIQEAYKNERTQLGKSILKQLMEAIQ